MSRPSFNKSVVLAAALVLSFGAAGEAGAQRQIPIRKDAPPPRDTVVMPAVSPEVRRDTIWVVRQDTINVSRVDTVVMIRDATRNRLGGLYFGIGGAFAGLGGDQLLHPRCLEKTAFRVLRLRQAIAVRQDLVTGLHVNRLHVVLRALEHPERHSRRLQRRHLPV